MKKTFKFFAAALAIVAAASCAKEISNDNIQAPEQELVHKVFTASLNVDPETGTKTTLHEDGVTVHWAESDVIKLLPVNSTYGTDFSVLSCDGAFADFEGETVNATSYRAVYPADALFTGGHINFISPEPDYYILGSATTKCALAHQFAVENNFSVVEEFGASSNFAISTHYSESGNLYFKNINAYLKIRLAMENAASIEVSALKVMKYPDAYDNGSQSLSDEAKLGGPIAIDYANKNKMGIITRVGEDITFEKQDGSNLLPNVDYYIAIPAVKMEGLKLVVKDENGKVLQSLTKSTFTPSSNTIYNLGTIELSPIPTANVGDYYYSDGTYSTTLDASKTVVGVVFYTGDPTADDKTLKKDYPDCIHGLVVGLTPTTGMSIGSKATGSWDSADFMTTAGADYASGYVILEPGYLMTGYNNTQAIRYADPQAPSISICDGMQTVPNASKWFVPSVAEFAVINSVRDIVNASINNVRGEGLYGEYLTSTEMKSFNTWLAIYNVNNKSLRDTAKNDSGAKIRVIFAF